MDPLFKFVEKDNHLKLGDYSFSPIMKISAGLALEYCKKVKKDDDYKQPFFFCFPEKKRASLWTSIILLTNYFFEDYFKNEIEGIQLQRSDKVKIFDCIAEVEAVTTDVIYLRFKDQGSIPIKGLRSQLSKVGSDRKLSLKRNFDSKLRTAKNSRSTISKILIPNDSDTINPNNLDSKILFVAGRGNVKMFHEFLDHIKIYDEPLSKVFSPKKNLIITPDLKNYADAFNVNREKQIEDFRELVSRLIEILDIEEAKNQLSEMLQKLIEENVISLEFDNLFNNFHNSFSAEIPQLGFLESKYPGYQDVLPEKLRAVVINDIQQVKDYSMTIEGFLKNGIPVIVISNRNIESSMEFDFFKRFFSENPNHLRINWNRKKISELIKYGTEEDYLDKQLWATCKRYANQQIYIRVFQGNILDSLAPRLIKHIKELDLFEKLQTSFYNNFYPSLYSIKNSKVIATKTLDMVFQFENDFNLVKNLIDSVEIIKDFEDSIAAMKESKINSKEYDDSENVFTSDVPNKNLFIPNNRHYLNYPDSQTESIFFTGYPYNEYVEKNLSNSVFVNFVPKIDILCWPIESSLTLRYLKRRLGAGYFFDNIAELAPLNKSYLIQSDKDIDDEIETFFKLNEEIPNETEQEENLEHLHTFKYKGYGTHSGQNSSFKVKCDVLNFSDGNFMFLPKGSSILTLSDSILGQVKIAQLKVNDIEVGHKIFKYKKDRGTFREISKTDITIEKHFHLLETWKSKLVDIYEKCDRNITQLEALLKSTKTLHNLENGNPNKASIQRWLFDDEIIRPDNSNVKIIFYAAGIEDIDTKLSELDFAYKSVLSFTIGLSSKIKGAITQYAGINPIDSTDFFVMIKGHKIDVESRTIDSKIHLEMEVDYNNTRKILC